MANEKITAKIRALLQMTQDAGCSEAEAVAAAAKASELMAAYDVDPASLEEVQEEKYGKRRYEYGGGSRWRAYLHESWNCISAIGYFTDCKSWASGSGVTFFGSQSDTEIAKYLLDMIKNVMDLEWRVYSKSDERPQGVHGRTLRASFMRGMTYRISKRLREMKDARNHYVEQSETGRELMIVKKQIVERKFEALDIKIHTVSNSLNAHASAWGAGQDAGDRVNLNTGISQKSGYIQIGG